MGEKMKNSQYKNSISEKILNLGDFLKQPRTSEEIKIEIKDRLGHNFETDDIRVNLLYLLRREKISRKKDGKVYKYYL